MSDQALTITKADMERMLLGLIERMFPPERAEAMYGQALNSKLSLVPLKLLPMRIGKPSVGAARNFLRSLGVPVIRVNHKEQFVDLNALDAAIRAHEVAVPAASKPVLRREAAAA